MLSVNHLIGFGATEGIIPASLSFRTNTFSETDLTTYTFSSQDIGTAVTGRRVIVGVGGVAAASRTISSVTIGGNSAAQSVFAEATTTAAEQAAIYVLQVDAGTTADIVVTWSSGMVRCAIGVWAAYDLQSSTATHTGSSTASPGTANLNVSAGGVAFGMAINLQNSGTNTYTWNNLTEAFDASFGSGIGTYSGAESTFATAQSGLTITATPTGSDSRVMAIASYR